MSLRVFDGHTHAFPDKIAQGAVEAVSGAAKWLVVRPSHDGTISGLVGAMDRAGIHKSILCSIATRPAQVQKITDWSASIASDRVVPLASVHPDTERPEEEIARIAQLGIRGVKFHPHYMCCPPDDPRTVRIARSAAGAGLAMAIHAGHDMAYEASDIATPRRVRRLHEAVPDLRLLACHLGGWQQWEEVLEQLAGLDVYIDTSFSIGHCPDDLLLRIIERHRPTHLLFGTDSPWADPSSDLAAFLRLPIPDDVRQLALWDNAHRFLGLV